MNGNGYMEDLDTLLDSLDFDDAEFEERTRRGRSRSPVRTPSRRSSLPPTPSRQPASQSQVQGAARNLDAKIETLSNAVKALESKTNGIAADQDRAAVVLRKEVAERKKGTDATRADLQQTKMLAVLLPLLTQQTVDATDANGQSVRVVTQSQNQLATLLPLLLIMPGSYGGDGAKGPLGDGILPLLLILTLTDRR